MPELNPRELDRALKARLRRSANSLPTRAFRVLKRALAHLVNRAVSSRWVAKLLGYLRTEDAVLKKYDEMAGEYIRFHRELLEGSQQVEGVLDHKYGTFNAAEVQSRKHAFMADEVLKPLGVEGQSILEIGAGELTTLVSLARRLPGAGEFSALELSWSRIALGGRFAEENGVALAHLVAGSAYDLPLADDAFDIVYTAHCLEQIPMNTEQVLRELARVARKHVVLFEPAYDLANSWQRTRMRHKHYVRNLAKKIRKLGFNLVRHELVPHCVGWLNRTGCYVIAKRSPGQAPPPRPARLLACPICKTPTEQEEHLHFCERCGRVFPIIGGIHCLARESGILASRYRDLHPTG